MKDGPKIKLFGTSTCHKTTYYKRLLEEKGLPYVFLDVKDDAAHAAALRNLYVNNRLNFPTLTIGDKKLRNPHVSELEKWINKLNVNS